MFDPGGDFVTSADGHLGGDVEGDALRQRGRNLVQGLINLGQVAPVCGINGCVEGDEHERAILDGLGRRGGESQAARRDALAKQFVQARLEERGFARGKLGNLRGVMIRREDVMSPIRMTRGTDDALMPQTYDC